MTEVVEPRTLMSAVSVGQLDVVAGATLPTTKEVTVEAEYLANTGGHSLKIDEIRLVDDEIQVFCTTTTPPLGAIVTQALVHHREARTVTVPNRELTVVYRYANLSDPQYDLYFLRQSGTSSLLYRSPLADTATAWPIVDVDPGPGSDLGIDFTGSPATPVGLAAKVGEEQSDGSRNVTLYFDERWSAISVFTPPIVTGIFAEPPSIQLFDGLPSSSIASSQRFVNRYELRFKRLNGTASGDDDVVGTAASTTQVVLMDTASFSLSGPGSTISLIRPDGTISLSGTTRTFRGRMETTATFGSHAFQVRVQKLPVFPDGATGTNALASPWSDWSDWQTWTALPTNEQILMRPVGINAETSEATIGWSIVENAASYEIWIEQAGKPVLRKAGLTGTQYRPDVFLGTGEFKVWVKAVRTDGTTTGWSKPVSYTVPTPTLRVKNLYNNLVETVTWHDKTPTLKWTGNPLATQYQISFIDLDKEAATITMRFASAQDRINFITAYTRTLAGTTTEHTVETPLAAGRYRVELQMKLGHVAAISTSGLVTIDTADSEVAFLMPGSTSTVQWHRGDTQLNYEVWVAYLGPESGQTIISRQSPKWFFDFAEHRFSTYRFADDAPGGKYRIWVRPRSYDGPHYDDVGPWGRPADITLQDPLLRSAAPAVPGTNGKLTWNPVPGAQGYEVVVWLHHPLADEADRLPSSPANDRFQSNNAEFQLPYDLMVRYQRILGLSGLPFGSGTVWIRPLNSRLAASTQYSERASIQFSWQPGFTKLKNRIQWNAVPDAIRYEIRIRRLDSEEHFIETTVSEPSIQLSPDLEPGKYVLNVRVIRRSGVMELPATSMDYGFGVAFRKPGGLRVDGTVLAWNPVENATRYLVSVETIGGDMFRQFLPGDPVYQTPVVSEPNRFSRFTFTTESTSFDLAARVLATYRNAPTLRFRVTVQVVPLPGPQPQTINPSESIEFTPTGIPAYSVFAPTIERTAQPKPQAPWLFEFVDDGNLGIGPSLRLSSEQYSVQLASHQSRLGGGAGGVIYRAENGTLFDLEHVARFQLRVTDLQTGNVSFFDESQILALMRFQDRSEAPFDFGRGVLRSISFPAIPNSQNAGFRIPGLLTGAYRVEARVQYLPVILQATQSDFNIPSDLIVPDHINVAATPWSDWSTPLDYSVLPAGENILPWTKSGQTIDPRPTFGWGSNTPNAQYELWVENRVTKVRVLQKLLSNVRAFTPTADLPVGQYDWWVRIVGTEGARKGWSAKQSLEVFAPAISSTVVPETVDATPVVSWTAVSNAQSYLVKFTSTSTGRVIYQATEASNRSSHRVAVTLPNDTYTVSIQALLSNGGFTAPGIVNADGGFNVPKMVVGAPPKNVTLSSSKVSWNAVNGATRYQVWLSVTNSGGTTRILKTDEYNTELVIPGELDSYARLGVNEFRVWVRAIRNEDGHESTGRWSVPGRYILRLDEFSGQPISATVDSRVLTTVMSELATSALLNTIT